MVNLNKIKTFEGGYSTDLTDNVEPKNTYQKAVNGRLYSKNGVFSFSGGKGTKLVYSNPNIVKYIGSVAFKDEFIAFAKVLKNENFDSVITEVCQTNITANTFIVNVDENNSVLGEFTFNNEFVQFSNETEICYTIETPPENEANFNNNISCADSNTNESINLEDYYILNANVQSLQTCNINNNETPVNNIDYYDALYSFSYNDDLNLVSKLLWVGMLNWPINGKITGIGNDENEFYKRVWFTDAFNQRRVFNIKDTSLINRLPKEFNQVLDNVLLQPEIKSVTLGGQLKAMKSLYVYRIISENGQISEFSPASEFAYVLKEDEAVKFKGGRISENTNKKVTVKCNIIDFNPNDEVECVALEYEGFGVPTAIKSLGIKTANEVVEFTHVGNEAEFATTITYNDILNYKNTWQYCNDFATKKNKLIAAGLRNDPLPSAINNLEYLFSLHSWTFDGETHNCLLNPEPWRYRYIDPTFTGKILYVKKKVYRTISSFGPLTLTFKNNVTNDQYQLVIDDLEITSYTNITTRIADWLLDLQLNDVNWSAYFPNLLVQKYQDQILLKPIDENIETDLADYIFQSDNAQFIENFENDFVFLNVQLFNQTSLVYGAQSIGFNEGNGIRITYTEFKEPLLNQAMTPYDGTGELLDYETPSLEKYCMKGEIYRLGIQFYAKDSTRFFTVPIGDLFIPEIGENIKEIDNNGNIIINQDVYKNQSVENGVLYGHGIKMKIEVRLSCELQKQISMYQIVHVERTEDNRTILCQGIAQPLQRTQFNPGAADKIRMPEPVTNKWHLPYYGGPTYDKIGLEQYDLNGENYQYEGPNPEERIMTNRKLMYFDSPDLYFNKISDQYISISQLQIVSKLKTDHTPGVIRSRGGLPFGVVGSNNSNEVYPKFSRKIVEQQIEGVNNSENLPKINQGILIGGQSIARTAETHFINVSVFANSIPFKQTYNIANVEKMNRGQIISGTAMDLANDLSNNTFCLPSQPWYYGDYQRDWKTQGGEFNSEVFRMSMTSPGYQTIFIKTDEDVFTDQFIGEEITGFHSEIRLGGDVHCVVYDTTPLINIFRNNRETVYGGRSVQAYSKNTFIPLSKTIPVARGSNAAQVFYAGADTYVTLNVRLKNDYGDDEIRLESVYNDGDASAQNKIDAWTRNGAWAYVNVIESQVEPKLTFEYDFYKLNNSHNFNVSRDELINPAYLNVNNLKQYVPKPFKFKDDPNQGNVVAVSDVKLAGELYDSWTVFKPNNFYAELEKNKGDVTNLVMLNEEIFAIQEQQTSLLYIGTDRILTDDAGRPVNIQQGSGTVVEGHKILSDFGTSFRRAVSESIYGFCFFDERKIEFVKVDKPLLTANFLHFEFLERTKKNKIVNTEAYFNNINKESCIVLYFKDGSATMLSYNEMFEKFNGEFEYKNNIFMQFDEKIFSPIIKDGLSEQLHEHDAGHYLEFFNELKDLKLGYYFAGDIDKVIQFKQLSVITNIKHKIRNIFTKSNIGYDRNINQFHPMYLIREGTHSIPMINETDNEEQLSDVRGNWVYVELCIQPTCDEKIDILSTINYIRYSHQ